MKYLAIDTSGDYLVIVMKNDDKILRRNEKTPGVKHSVTLMPAIEEMSDETGLNLKDVDFFACATGPGSFTGIRIGVSTIKGFADAYSKPVLPVTTLETLAYTEIGKRLAVIDAKHDHYYAQGYTGDEVTFQPEYISKEKLIDLQKEYKTVSATPLEGIDVKIVDVSEGLICAIEKNLARVSYDVDSLHPFYLRLSQAEEGRK